ncbi:MAG: peptidase [Lysobacteraceae bacterium]
MKPFRTLSIRTKSIRTLSALACLALAACAATPHDTATPTAASDAPRPIGGDRDAHGCLPAAGYAWCARVQQCVRPWELAKEKGFDNSPAGYDAWCDAKDAPTTP